MRSFCDDIDEGGESLAVRIVPLYSAMRRRRKCVPVLAFPRKKSEGARGGGRVASFLVLLTVLGICISSRSALAHPISLSSATVDVREDRMNAEIQIMLEDLVLYHSLKTGADYLYTLEDLNRAAEDHRDFLTRYFLVRDTDGNLVAGRIVNLDRHLLTEGVAQGDLMTKSVIYRFEFPLSARQEFLTITQTFGGPNAVLPAVMDLMLLQNGILIETPMQLTQGQALTARFDWDHP
ncbi:MAG: hypothetical protein O2960_10150, partial [Verrucomicrobia bacterium]|nr:hypothetical protein [Verrucomicrobiota bacterium]